MKFFTRIKNAVWLWLKKWFGELTTEEKLYQMLNTALGKKQATQLCQLVTDTVSQLTENREIPSEKKCQEAKELIAIRMDEIAVGMRNRVKQHVINALIELAVTRFKIERSELNR